MIVRILSESEPKESQYSKARPVLEDVYLDSLISDQARINSIFGVRSMDIFLHEFMKVFTKRSVLVFLVIAISINGILLYRNENKGYSSIKPSSYKEVYKDLASMSDEQNMNSLRKSRGVQFLYVDAVH